MRILRLIAALSLAAAAWANSVTYTIKVDTSAPGMAGSAGVLDFQFNRDAGTFSPAQIAVMRFNGGGGSLDVSPGGLTTYGDVTGDLPDTVTFLNDISDVNVYSPGFTYGDSIEFQALLEWDRPDVPPDTPTYFYFTMYDRSYDPLLTSTVDPPYQAAELRLNPDGTVSALSYSPQVTVSGPGSDAPEPATWLLIAPALGMVFRGGRTRKA